jgi:hypothetical protein
MPDSKDEQTVFVGENNLAAITCPKCNYLMVEEISEENEGGVCIEYTCRCGHIYEVFLERRHFYRKSTQLQGVCTRAVQDISVIVTDISLTGLKFRCIGENTLKVGDVLYIEVQLDYRKHSAVLKKAKVRLIENSYVGAEFIKMDDHQKMIPYLYAHSIS